MSAIPLRQPETAAAEFDRRAGHDRQTRFLLKHLFDQESRIRSLESKPPLPEAQFRAQIKQAFGT